MMLTVLLSHHSSDPFSPPKQEFGYGGFIRLEHGDGKTARMMRDDGHFFREVDRNLWDPEQRLKEMDDTGAGFFYFLSSACTLPLYSACTLRVLYSTCTVSVSVLLSFLSFGLLQAAGSIVVMLCRCLSPIRRITALFFAFLLSTHLFPAAVNALSCLLSLLCTILFFSLSLSLFWCDAKREEELTSALR